MGITLIIDTPSGLATLNVADATPDVAFDLAPGDYVWRDGAWKQTKREKGEGHD